MKLSAKPVIEKRALPLVFLILAAFSLLSCAPFGTSKKERVERFEIDLKESREYVYQNFLEAETDDYTTIRDSDTTYTWDDWFPLEVPAGSTYTISLDSAFGNPLVGTIDGPGVFEFRTLVPYVKKYIPQYLAGLLFLLLTNGGQLYIPQLLRRAIDTIASGTFTLADVLPIVLMIVGISAVIAVGRYYWRYFLHGASRRIESELRERLFVHLQSLSSAFYGRVKTGDLMARMTNDMRAIRMATGMALVAFVDGFFMTVAIIAIMLSQNPRLTLLCVSPLPVITVGIIFFGKLIGEQFRKVQEDPLRGKISLKNLSYTYPQTGKQILAGIDLEIPAGCILGVLGKTGSGKSTLVHLLPRLLDPPPKTVFVDDRDIHAYDLATLRAGISMVPQDTFLFSDSIRNNIAFASRDEDGEEEIRNVAAISTIERDFNNFPSGWETVVGERGITLSGGQKQRVAISRALASEASVYILDDSLSSVDTETEDAILQGLLPFLEGKTLIIVSHRISTLKTADTIIVLDQGRIVQQGSHEKLLGQKGFYADIYRLQQLEEAFRKKK